MLEDIAVLMQLWENIPENKCDQEFYCFTINKLMESINGFFIYRPVTEMDPLMDSLNGK